MSLMDCSQSLTKFGAYVVITTIALDVSMLMPSPTGQILEYFLCRIVP